MTVHAVRLDQGAEVPGPERRLSVHSGWALAFSRGLITERSSPDFDTVEVVRRWDEKPDLLTYGVGALVRWLPVAGAGPRHRQYDVVEFVRQYCSQGFGWLAGEVR